MSIGPGRIVPERGDDPWETAIGLEVHVQLRTATKMFCRCSASFGAPPNTQVCPVCLGLPGALPVPNRRAVELAVRAALALGCEVHPSSRFVRKHYFYPDLPKGYQITQLDQPLATAGRLWLAARDGEREVRVRRTHLEEDAGKLIHDRHEGRTAVDLNRAGTPLIEIVTEPDLRSPAEARAFLARLKQILEHFAAVSDCNMEEGSLRVDANISVRAVRRERLGTKTEVKNLNSFRFVERALAYERDRQARILAAGGAVERDTRRFDPGAGETRGIRGKEEETDYRYFPDPDLRPVTVSRDTVARILEELGPLPRQLERRLMADYGLSAEDAERVAATPGRADYFRRAVADGDGSLAKTVATFLMGEVAAEANRRGGGVPEEEIVPADRLRRVAELRLDGTLSSDTAAEALRRLFSGWSADVDALVRQEGLTQVRDEEKLAAWVEDAVRGHPEEAARYAAGEEQLLGFFMGAVMRAAAGRADPTRARKALRERLEAEKPKR